jgi:arginase family enzyme
VGDRPIHLLEAGIVTEQRYAGVSEAPAALGALFADRLGAVKRIRVPFNPRDRWLTAAREACRVLADAVTLSLRAGATVVILGGECTLVAGAVPGALEVEPDLTLIYLDAHADFNTLATTPSHFVGGMCLAHVCGRPVAALLWPGARRMTDERTVLVGARQLDLGESGNLLRSRILRIPFDREQPDAPGLLAAVRRRAVWVHIDVDVVDPREMPAVVGPVEGGPGLAALRDLLAGIAQVSEVRGMELCGYDPRQDPDERLPRQLADAVTPLLAPRPAASSISERSALANLAKLARLANLTVESPIGAPLPTGLRGRSP